MYMQLNLAIPPLGPFISLLIIRGVASFHGGFGEGCVIWTCSLGSIRVYDLPEKKLLCHSEFASGGSALMWAPIEIDEQAVTLIAGFADGVVR